MTMKAHTRSSTQFEYNNITLHQESSGNEGCNCAKKSLCCNKHSHYSHQIILFNNLFYPLVAHNFEHTTSLSCMELNINRSIWCAKFDQLMVLHFEFMQGHFSKQNMHICFSHNSHILEGHVQCMPNMLHFFKLQMCVDSSNKACLASNQYP